MTTHLAMNKWSIVLVSKSSNWGDWVVGQWCELADFSKLCKWSEVNKLGNHTVGKGETCANSWRKVLDREGSQASRVCFISQAIGESFQSGRFDKCSSFGKSGRRTSLKSQ